MNNIKILDLDTFQIPSLQDLKEIPHTNLPKEISTYTNKNILKNLKNKSSQQEFSRLFPSPDNQTFILTIFHTLLQKTFPKNY